MDLVKMRQSWRSFDQWNTRKYSEETLVIFLFLVREILLNIRKKSKVILKSDARGNYV